MLYESTRGQCPAHSAAQALVAGIAPDGGLFVPAHIPTVENDLLRDMLTWSDRQRAAHLLGLFFDFDGVEEATAPYDDFTLHMAPLGDSAALELWHGPTAAFKDMALQVLPRLMVSARKALGMHNNTLILTATSGDTGSAALAGFADVPGTAVTVFYPYGGVSPVQRLQMLCQEGQNVQAIAIRGNFDDAQRGVKAIFADAQMREKLLEAGWELSSANSINWGRLAPQIAYYFSAYCHMVTDFGLPFGELITFTVPTGNFGNILAGWYAKQMGLPIAQLICASNANRVLTDFFAGGRYDARRPFYKTISPSMDILVSSNLERLLYELSGRDASKVRGYMQALQSDGAYQVDEALQAAFDAEFAAGCADDDATRGCIADTLQRYGYLCDPHTAVAVQVWQQLGSPRGVVVSTASPYKFAGDMLRALGEEPDGVAKTECSRLQQLTAVPVTPALARRLQQQEPAEVVIDAADMPAAALRSVGL